MSAAEKPVRTGVHSQEIPRSNWQTFEHETAFQCSVLLCPEGVGFSAHCLNLPGVISQGDTEQEALANIEDAFRETILYYRESGTAIPWGEVEEERTPGSLEKWILVKI